MKKIILITLVIFSLTSLLYFFPKEVYARPGDQCRQAGGSCKISCSAGEQNWGKRDCANTLSGDPTTCCAPAGVSPAPVTGGGIQPTECDSDGDGVDDGIMTALGCIPTKETGKFVAWLLKLAISIGGGIAFLLMLFAGFQIITSSGNPEKLQAGKELLTSAISGLILIIFSLFLLQLIGVKILQIPGFG